MHPARQSLTAPGFLGEPGRFRARQRLVAPSSTGTPPAFTVDFINEVDDDGFCIGGVQAVPSGGTAPYAYHWVDDAAGQGDQFTDTLTNACGPSDWTLTVTDDIGQVVVVPWHVYRAEHTGDVSTTSTKAVTAYNFPATSISYDAASLALERFQTVYQATVSAALVATLAAVRYNVSASTTTARSLTNTSGVTADVGGTEDLPFEFNFPGGVQQLGSNQRIYGPTSRLAGQTVVYATANRSYNSGDVPIPGFSNQFDGTGTLDASVSAQAPSFTPLNAWSSSSVGTRSFGCTVQVIYTYHCARQ